MISSEASSAAATSSAGDGRYVVVARRYRPRSFEQLVGQQHVGQALCNAIETGRVGHAYLFTGARGVGKTSTARIFAKALNDPGGPTPHPSGDSDIAQAIDAGEDVDVLEIDGASNRGIDEIRSLRAGVGIRPSRSRYKIYIIDEVHMLTPAAFNALLKTLEEPPPHVKFIFCTTDPEKIPITVLSRCQRFDFAPVQTDEILGRLREIVDAEGVKADDEALRLIARRAEGSMRDSQSLLEQVMSFSGDALTAAAVHAMLGTADDMRLHELGKTLAAGDAATAMTLVEKACGEGVAPGRLAEQLLGYFRDMLTVAVGCPPSMQRHTGEALHAELRELADRWGRETVLAIVGLIDHALTRIRHSMHGRVLLEAALIQVCHLPNLQQVADLAASLTAGGAVPAAASRAAPQAEKKNDESLSPAAPAGREHSPSEPNRVAVDAPHSSPPAPYGPGARANGTPPTAAALTGAQPPAVRFQPDSGTGTSVKTAAPAGGPAGKMVEPARSHIAGAPHRGAAPQPKSRMQRMRELESDPYVKACLDIFGAEIVKIDLPRVNDS